MSGLVFDTSLYVLSFRQRRPELLEIERYGKGPLYLSSVVGQELYVGASLRSARRDIDRFWRHFEQSGRLLVPGASDWRETGLVLNQVGEQVGFDQLRLKRLTNDALIALSSRRAGLTVVTRNGADFALLARFRRFSFVVADPQAIS